MNQVCIDEFKRKKHHAVNMAAGRVPRGRFVVLSPTCKTKKWCKVIELGVEFVFSILLQVDGPTEITLNVK